MPLLAIAGVTAGLKWTQKDLVTVQTATAARADLTAQVTASGEIKPRNYINLGANAQGPITDLLVKEGARVKKGQVVAKIENVQARADVQAQKASVSSSEADSNAAEVGLRVFDDSIKSQAATLERMKTELGRAKLNLDRYNQMYEQKLVARQEYDQRKADYDSAAATVRENEARLQQLQSQKAQALAQLSSTQRRVAQAQAGLTRISDVLAKHDVVAPIDGVVTNLPVRVGETVVPGVQNSAASTIMTIADMSLITAEVKVDETDIVNVKLDQVVSITIEAIPNRTFAGHVIEIGNTAILRSSGLAASQSANSTQEAKDFKVVIALDNPPDEIRPGLSCSAKITTATRKNVLAIPIQALTVRTKADLEPQQSEKAPGAPANPNDKSRKEEIQGVFVVANGHAEFRKVETGITGSTDIESINGLKEGEEIVTGSYKAIRTLRNLTRLKVDNRTPAVARVQ
ncbi:MAG TPA: efflux RND transporter periplasmic adaptor subunit [Bryobacteraceae bacterium]|nr:efflux RND transporter periplasmic adaptor subunit [Bryobacteraceae bacterium]